MLQDFVLHVSLEILLAPKCKNMSLFQDLTQTEQESFPTLLVFFWFLTAQRTADYILSYNVVLFTLISLGKKKTEAFC